MVKKKGCIMEEPSKQVDGEKSCLGKDKSPAKQANEGTQEEQELMKVKTAATNAIAQVIAQLQGLQSEVESAQQLQDIKKSFWVHAPRIKHSVDSLTGLHEGPMSGALDEHLEHTASFLDRNDKDSFALVSTRMRSVVESHAKDAHATLLKQLKKLHYVDDKWHKRVYKSAELTGAHTYRHMLVCATQVSLYSIQTENLRDFSCKFVVLPQRNEIIVYTHPNRNTNQTLLQVLDLDTRQVVRPFGHLQRDYIESLQLCGTFIVACASRTVTIWTMDGDLVHTVNGTVNFDQQPEALLTRFAVVGEMLYFISSDIVRCMISELDVQSGQITRRVQQQFPYRDSHGSPNKLFAAGGWLLCLEPERGIHVLNPTDLNRVSFFQGFFSEITASADNEDYAVAFIDKDHVPEDRGYNRRGLILIMSINDGELQVCHSLTARPHEDYIPRMTIHDTTLYVAYNILLTPDDEENELMPIDAIDMISGDTFGRLSFPYYNRGIRCSPFDLFTSGNELFGVFDDNGPAGDGLTVRAFPMV